MDYSNAFETVREHVLAHDMFRLQIGENWCWAAVTASLLNQALTTVAGANPKHRQCDIVRRAIGQGRQICHRQDLPEGQWQVGSKVSPCDPQLCHITNDIDVIGNLYEELASRSLMKDLVAHTKRDTIGPRQPGDAPLKPDMLSDQLEIEDVIRLTDQGMYIVLRFIRPDRTAHFIVIYGYVVSHSIKAVKFFDPANGASTGFRLRGGHGVRPLREVKTQYGTMATSLLIVSMLPEN